ncbi:MAG TPA: GGDEF domain-containing protein [Caldimonas sp.]|nr:GGDEF domain-containing protein [Caldimonas sp.]HEX4236250.1 GGDEF domain-containing protein [Caldimonas sp.]
MSTTRPSPLAKVELSTAQIAKAALRRLATERLEPTPENYERAYRQEAGEAPESTEALAVLIERIIRGIERTGHNWTPARRKEGIHRVLASGRSDAKRLQHRLSQLVNSWEGDTAATPVGVASTPATASRPAPLDALATAANAASSAANDPATPASSPPAVAWERVARSLGHGLQQALPAHDGANQELARELARLVERMHGDAPASLADDTDALVRKVERVLQHRHHLFDQLGKLCHELTSSLTDIAEDGSWVKGQCEAMTLKIEEGLSARGVRAVSDMLHHARKRQGEVRGEREKARDALKALITQMLAELGELGSKTGNFHESVGRYAEVIEQSDSLESLTGVVREMVAESRAVQTLVQQTQERLQQEHSKAIDLTQRVVELEDEMKRLSDEVSTDQLTQIANRRGLMQAFEIERARLERSGGELSIGLLDIDNFKRLNDELGHSAGDEALKSLAAVVSKTLRPTDRVARYGGEEFVVLLPQTPPSEGEQVLTRLQRSLTGGLFMHKDKQIFVTFSAGVTDYRLAERIEDSLERADQALYEAKRTGKNRTCIG